MSEEKEILTVTVEFFVSVPKSIADKIRNTVNTKLAGIDLSEVRLADEHMKPVTDDSFAVGYDTTHTR